MRPAKVAGSTVARATLHNLDEVRRKDLRIGDWIVLQKAGDVIPEVVRPIPERRTGAEREFEMPAACPVCGTAVVRDEGAVRHYCPNPRCPARLAQEFAHFAGRGGMDIEGAGWAVLEQLLERGLVKTRGDFYRLTRRGPREPRAVRAEERREPEGLDRASRAGGRWRGCSTPSASPRWASRRPSTSPAGSPRAGRPRGCEPAEWFARGRGAARRRRPTSVPGSARASAPWWPRRIAGYFARPETAAVLRGPRRRRRGRRAARRPSRRPGSGAAAGPLAGKTVVVTGSLAGFDRAGRRGGDPRRRRQGRGLGQQEHVVRGGGRRRRLQAGQGRGARRPGPRRGRVPPAAAATDEAEWPRRLACRPSRAAEPLRAGRSAHRRVDLAPDPVRPPRHGRPEDHPRRLPRLHPATGHQLPPRRPSARVACRLGRAPPAAITWRWRSSRKSPSSNRARRSARRHAPRAAGSRATAPSRSRTQPPSSAITASASRAVLGRRQPVELDDRRQVGRFEPRTRAPGRRNRRVRQMTGLELVVGRRRAGSPSARTWAVPRPWLRAESVVAAGRTQPRRTARR